MFRAEHYKCTTDLAFGAAPAAKWIDAKIPAITASDDAAQSGIFWKCAIFLIDKGRGRGVIIEYLGNLNPGGP